MVNDSRCFTKHLYKYPLLLVLTAVSIRPSLPAIQWKKNSGDLNPRRKRSEIYPPALGLGSNGRKHGKVLPLHITGTLLPSNSYYPRRAET